MAALISRIDAILALMLDVAFDTIGGLFHRIRAVLNVLAGAGPGLGASLARPVRTMARALHDRELRLPHWLSPTAARRFAMGIGLVGLPLLATHLLAHMALADVAETTRSALRAQGYDDLASDSGGLLKLSIRSGGIGIYGQDGRASVVRGQSGFVDQVVLVDDPPGLLASDRNGQVVLTRLGPATRNLDELSRAYAAAERWIWSTIGRSLSRQALHFVLGYRALELADIAWGGEGGRFIDCEQCPPMTVFRPGAAIVGRGWFESGGEPDLGRRRLIEIDGAFAIGRLPIQGGAPNARELQALLDRLRSSSGRGYRLATANERAYARAGGSEADRFASVDLDAAPGIFVAVDIAPTP